MATHKETALGFGKGCLTSKVTIVLELQLVVGEHNRRHDQGELTTHVTLTL